MKYIPKLQLGKTIDWLKQSLINPKNWGVADYSDKGNFDTAYSSARKAGEEEFMWNNKRYSTKKDTDPIYKDDSLNLYAKSKYPNYIKSVNKNLDLKSDTIASTEKAHFFPNENKIFYNSEESFNAELAHEVRNENTLIDDIKYRIEKREHGKNVYDVPNTLEYKTHRMTQPGLAFVREANLSEEDIKKVQNYLKVKPDGFFHENSYKALVDKYYDEKEVNAYLKNNKYEFYDKDLKDNNLKYPYGDIIGGYYLDKIAQDKNIRLKSLSNHPYYYFYDSDFKGAYYSDKELSELDINKKNFDTLALQIELSNRGYKLPKSTKEDGTFDGILGDEAKNALLNWQLKNKRPTLKKGGTIPKLQSGDQLNLLRKVSKSNADFVNRLKQPNRDFIKDWASPNIATHKMSWATDDKGAIIYPQVQNINGKLTDFTRPPYNEWAGLDSAIERGDTLKTTPEMAQWFTTNYKKFFPKFTKGGKLIPKAQIGRTLTYNWASPPPRVTTLEQRKKMYEKVNPSLGQNFISAIQLGKTYLGISDRGTAPVRDEEYFKKYLGLPYDEKLVPKSKYRPVIDTLNVQYTGIDDRTKHYIQQMVDTNLVKNRINELYTQSDNTTNENQAANYRRTASDFEKHLGILRNLYANPGKSYVINEGNSLTRELLPESRGMQTFDTGVGFLKDFTVTNIDKDLISVKDDYNFITPIQRFLGGTPYPIYDRVNTKVDYLKRYNQK